ncbi:hypothetical protein LTT66_26040 [Nocardia gipuzkoensis]|uniref:hypothetical protein n=1 Tax=Nocardia gipuzkoensis TaxID=2749991 RepID=UPI001E643FDB|nr:hypothetical protein [Nocardia gipuzkoensis]UGT66698.1 hypothetical protein LTT66_26040 [Nocardia gipuzkoensis]
MVIAAESGGAVSVVRGAATDPELTERADWRIICKATNPAALAQMQYLPFPERYP